MKEVNCVVCSCGEDVDEVDTTPEEEKVFGCGRAGCCVEAYECPKCKTRFTFSLNAPEVE